jgi:hypothetical protein
MENKDLLEPVDPRVTKEPQDLLELEDLKDLKDLKEVQHPFLET